MAYQKEHNSISDDWSFAVLKKLTPIKEVWMHLQVCRLQQG